MASVAGQTPAGLQGFGASAPGPRRRTTTHLTPLPAGPAVTSNGRSRGSSGRPRVAFAGEPGGINEEAVLDHYAQDVEPYPCPSFEDVFDAVESGEAYAGIVPVENTVDGSVARVSDLLLDRDLTIVAEILVRVNQALVGHAGTTLESLRTVRGTGPSLAACRRFFRLHGQIEPRPVLSVAEALRGLVDAKAGDSAVICPPRMAAFHQLAVLKDHLEDDHDNTTRFFVVAAHAESSNNADKTSIAFGVKNRPGALFDSLAAFATRGINLTKVESRPRRTRAWVYVFFIDFEGSLQDRACREAVGELLTKASFVKVLGSYERAELPERPGHDPGAKGS